MEILLLMIFLTWLFNQFSDKPKPKKNDHDDLNKYDVL